MSEFDEDELDGAEPLNLSDEDDDSGIPDELVEGEGLEGLVPGMHIDGEEEGGEGEEDEPPHAAF